MSAVTRSTSPSLSELIPSTRTATRSNGPADGSDPTCVILETRGQRRSHGPARSGSRLAPCACCRSVCQRRRRLPLYPMVTASHPLGSRMRSPSGARHRCCEVARTTRRRFLLHGPDHDVRARPRRVADGSRRRSPRRADPWRRRRRARGARSPSRRTSMWPATVSRCPTSAIVLGPMPQPAEHVVRLHRHQRRSLQRRAGGDEQRGERILVAAGLGTDEHRDQQRRPHRSACADRDARRRQSRQAPAADARAARDLTDMVGDAYRGCRHR